MKTLDQLKEEFIVAQAAAVKAALAFHQAAHGTDADPLAAHQGLGAAVTGYQPGGPLLTDQAVKTLVDQGVEAMRAGQTDWLGIAKKVLGTVVKVLA